LAAGLSYAALSRRHDWIWTFDFDSVPAADSLATMLGGIESLDRKLDIGMIAPMPVHRQTGTFYPPLLWRDGLVRPTIEQMRKPLWFADLVIASGSLVRRKVVETIGLPRADFFMDFFDFEYSLRARTHGYEIAVVPQAELGHEIGDARTVWFLGRSRLWTNQPPWRAYYFSRNLAYLGWWLYPNRRTKISVARFLAKRLAAVVFLGSSGAACAMRMIQGFHDGLRGRMEIRLRPGVGTLQGFEDAQRTGGPIEAEKA
jgi:GT2 family glycosyltransferase